ncbi:MAG: uracil-DNA glycosylase family protein [Bdellovibrionota bacterium]
MQQSWEGFLPKNAIVMAKKGQAAAVRAPSLGEGNPEAALVFCGEDPANLPARELLTKMIEAMGLSRAQVYVVPPTNLSAHLEAHTPKIIVALGAALGEYPRGEWTEFQGVRVMPTLHPADLITRPSAKKDVWADLQTVAQAAGISIPAPKRKS